MRRDKAELGRTGKGGLGRAGLLESCEVGHDKVHSRVNRGRLAGTGWDTMYGWGGLRMSQVRDGWCRVGQQARMKVELGEVRSVCCLKNIDSSSSWLFFLSSLGVGRTGAFCVIYTGQQEIQQGNGLVEVPELVRQLQDKRKYIMQDKEQLRFCYHAILYHAQDILMKCKWPFPTVLQQRAAPCGSLCLLPLYVSLMLQLQTCSRRSRTSCARQLQSLPTSFFSVCATICMLYFQGASWPTRPPLATSGLVLVTRTINGSHPMTSSWAPTPLWVQYRPILPRWASKRSTQQSRILVWMVPVHHQVAWLQYHQQNQWCHQIPPPRRVPWWHLRKILMKEVSIRMALRQDLCRSPPQLPQIQQSQSCPARCPIHPRILLNYRTPAPSELGKLHHPTNVG